MVNIILFILAAPFMLPCIAIGMTWPWWERLSKKSIWHKILWGILAPIYGVAWVILLATDWWFGLIGESF